MTGHVATREGRKVNPPKVRAIKGIPVPTNKAGVQQLLSQEQYLSKFLLEHDQAAV